MSLQEFDIFEKIELKEKGVRIVTLEKEDNGEILTVRVSGRCGMEKSFILLHKKLEVKMAPEKMLLKTIKQCKSDIETLFLGQSRDAEYLFEDVWEKMIEQCFWKDKVIESTPTHRNETERKKWIMKGRI